MSSNPKGNNVVDLEPENGTEYSVTFEADESVRAVLDMGGSTLHDIDVYDKATESCRSIFVERRGHYGSHLDKPAMEDCAGLYLKASRLCRDFESRKNYKRDTLIDMANYAIMILSRMDDEQEPG